MTCWNWNLGRSFFVVSPLLIIVVLYYLINKHSIILERLEGHAHRISSDKEIPNGAVGSRLTASTKGPVNRRALKIFLNKSTSQASSASRSSVSSVPKLLLAWTTFFGDKTYMMPRSEDLKCSLTDCVITDDRNQFESADAVMFHLSDVSGHELPISKPPGQRWLLVNYESPVNSPLDKLADFKDRLDWLVSYLQLSDYPSPYGEVHKRKDSDPPPPLKPSQQAFHTKLPVAWMVSNCNSKSGREDVARGIQGQVRLDVYGRCAPQFGSPPRTLLQSTGELQGYDQLAERYKFYLAFENSLCVDYVTEKAFLPLMVGMVPVVFGGADYKRILPPGSYVNARDFSSYHTLGSYLRDLSMNFTAYSRFFDWQEQYVVDHAKLKNNFLCDTCNRLHDIASKGGIKNVKKDFTSLLSETKNCVVSSS